MAEQKPIQIPVEGGGEISEGAGAIGALKLFQVEMSRIKDVAAQAAGAVEEMAERSSRAIRQTREEAAALAESFSTLEVGVSMKRSDTGIKDPRGSGSYKGRQGAGGVDMGAVTAQLNTQRGRV